MKLNILLFLAVLLVGCGGKTNKTTAENTAPSDAVAILIDGAYVSVDLDFDGNEEIVTDLQYGEGHRGCGTYQSVYKVRNDSLIEMRIDLLLDNASECIDYKIERGLFGVNLQTQEVYYVRIGGGLDMSYHIFKPANNYTYTLPTTGEPLFVMQYRLSRIVSYRYHMDGHSSVQIDYYEKADCDCLEQKSEIGDDFFFQNIDFFHTNVEQAASAESMDKDDSCIVYREHDVVHFSYIEPVENYYRVTGVVSEYLDESDFAFVELTFHNFKTHKDFTIYGGSVYWKYFLDVDSIPTAPVRLNYPNILAEGVISAPDNTPFFFADLDFDGEKELITGNHVNAGTQRGVGRYTDIYKIIDGEPHEVTQEFLAKSKIFDEMDEYYFMVNPDRRELILYESNGASASGWQVHKFIDGDYIYDRHVEYVELRTMNYDITVTTPQGDTIRTFTVDEATFNCEKWEY